MYFHKVRYWADVVITKEVIKIAAGNEENGKVVMTPLFEQRGYRCGDYRRDDKNSGRK